MKHDTEPFSLHSAKCKQCGQTWDLEQNVPGDGCVEVKEKLELHSTSFIPADQVVEPHQDHWSLPVSWMNKW